MLWHIEAPCRHVRQYFQLEVYNVQLVFGVPSFVCVCQCVKQPFMIVTSATTTVTKLFKHSLFPISDSEVVTSCHVQGGPSGREPGLG